jgi:hypothetical protein
VASEITAATIKANASAMVMPVSAVGQVTTKGVVPRGGDEQLEPSPTPKLSAPLS